MKPTHVAAALTIAVLAGAAALAQPPASSPQTAAAASPAPPSAAGAKSDGDFIQAAVQGDTSEIAMGQMLVDKGATPQVKAFGRMLVQDHTQSRQQAQAAAHAINVTAAETPAADSAKPMAVLHEKTGAEFDRQAKLIAIEDHKKDIALFEQEAASGKGPAADHARTTLPTLKKHLEAAQKLPG